MLGRTMHGMTYDPLHDEIFVPQPFAQSVLVFKGDSNGEERPIRFIQGPMTQLTRLDKLDVDPIHNEIFVPMRDRILVFSRTASGNVAPLRMMKMPEGEDVDSLGVDYLHDVVIGISNDSAYSRGKLPKILTFDRTAQGDVAPKTTIFGPKTMLTGASGMRAYPTKGLVLVAMNGPTSVEAYPGAFVGVWSITDEGDVPPRWTIGGPNGALKQPRGVDLDVKNKSILVADKVRNAVLTFYFPEMF
jgi:hypothetical protein